MRVRVRLFPCSTPRVQTKTKHGAAPARSCIQQVAALLRAPNDSAWTPLMFAARTNNTEVASVLLRAAQGQPPAKGGATAAAAAAGGLGGLLGALDKDGRSCLHCAAKYGHAEMASLILGAAAAVRPAAQHHLFRLSLCASSHS